MADSAAQPPAPPNGKITLLNALLSGDNSMKLITICLIVVSGGANFLGTQQVGTEVNLERDRAVQQIHDLYNRIDDFEKRQKIMLQAASETAESNAQQLKNQMTLLERTDQELAQLSQILHSINDERVRKNQPPNNF